MVRGQNLQAQAAHAQPARVPYFVEASAELRTRNFSCPLLLVQTNGNKRTFRPEAHMWLKCQGSSQCDLVSPQNLPAKWDDRVRRNTRQHKRASDDQYPYSSLTCFLGHKRRGDEVAFTCFAPSTCLRESDALQRFASKP